MDKKASVVDSNPTLHNVRRTSDGCCSYSAAILLLTFIFLGGCEREVRVPQHLIGQWETSAPGYADRYLKFTNVILIYGIGNGEEISHRIEKIDFEQLGQSTAYTFYYTDAEGDKAELSFIYRPDAGGTIRIKNDNKIWKKAAP